MTQTIKIHFKDDELEIYKDVIESVAIGSFFLIQFNKKESYLFPAHTINFIEVSDD